MITAPVFLAFIPSMELYITAGFAAIDRMPEYYQNMFFTAVSVGLGLRGGQAALKGFAVVKRVKAETDGGQPSNKSPAKASKGDG